MLSLLDREEVQYSTPDQYNGRVAQTVTRDHLITTVAQVLFKLGGGGRCNTILGPKVVSENHRVALNRHDQNSNIVRGLNQRGPISSSSRPV